MPGQGLLTYYWLLPLGGLTGVGLGLRFRVPVAVIASTLFAATAAYFARNEGSSLAATVMAAFAALVTLQAGYFVGALTVQR